MDLQGVPDLNMSPPDDLQGVPDLNMSPPDNLHGVPDLNMSPPDEAQAEPDEAQTEPAGITYSSKMFWCLGFLSSLSNPSNDISTLLEYSSK
jgi:hypothetical protein